MVPYDSGQTTPTYTDPTSTEYNGPTDTANITSNNPFIIYYETYYDRGTFKDDRELVHLIHVAERHAEQKEWWFAGFDKVKLYNARPQKYLMHRRMMFCNRFD